MTLDYGWGPSWDRQARLDELDLELAIMRRRVVLDAERPGRDAAAVTAPSRADTDPVTASSEPDDGGAEQGEYPYDAMNRQQLREECRLRGLPQRGTTMDMRARLVTHHRTLSPTPPEE